jgi:hypothetical protein
MGSLKRRIIFLGLFVILVGCFGVAWFLQIFSILTMTRVGTVGTLTGCITFLPALILIDVTALIVAYRERSGTARLPFLLLVLVANALLLVTGVTTIISTVRSLSSHTSLFTPRPEDILWDEWLMLFAIFVAPEIPAVVLAIVGLVGIKGRSR